MHGNYDIKIDNFANTATAASASTLRILIPKLGASRGQEGAWPDRYQSWQSCQYVRIGCPRKVPPALEHLSNHRVEKK
jgi:hypothetical protein